MFVCNFTSATAGLPLYCKSPHLPGPTVDVSTGASQICTLLSHGKKKLRTWGPAIKQKSDPTLGWIGEEAFQCQWPKVQLETQFRTWKHYFKSLFFHPRDTESLKKKNAYRSPPGVTSLLQPQRASHPLAWDCSAFIILSYWFYSWRL